jgi:hypothetical protein
MRLYPRGFLTEFGDSIDQAFRDSLRDAFQKRGYSGIALLWFRIIPDFVFSVVELLTSTSGDYLKWYFRLRWALACGLAFVVGELAALTLVYAGVLDYLGLPRHLGLAGFCIWLSLGLFQSRVLTARFCDPLRWTAFTVVGGVLGILFSRFLSEFSPIPMTFYPHLWKSWLFQLVLAGTAAITGAAIGLFQWSALKPGGGRRVRWVTACAFGAYVSALINVSTIPLMLPFANLLSFDLFRPVQSFVVGAVLGVITAGPLKRMLWPPSAELSQAELPERN